VFDEGTATLWLGVAAIGAWHGLNPAMGWPLAVANGLTEQRGAAVLATFIPLGMGHLLAIASVLMPFALLSWLLTWNLELRIAAGMLVLLFGGWRLLRRHPRWTQRVRPTQLVLWSFLIATAHGAALMLLPILIGLCETPDAAAARSPRAFDHAGMMALMQANLATALVVSLLHSAAMIGAGLTVAWIVYRHLGLRVLRVLRATWFNLDVVWALSLIASGAAAVAMALW
jgi:hypothetical protein